MCIEMVRKHVGKKGSSSLEIKEPQIKTAIQYPWTPSEWQLERLTTLSTGVIGACLPKDPTKMIIKLYMGFIQFSVCVLYVKKKNFKKYFKMGWWRWQPRAEKQSLLKRHETLQFLPPSGSSTNPHSYYTYHPSGLIIWCSYPQIIKELLPTG